MRLLLKTSDFNKSENIKRKLDQQQIKYWEETRYKNHMLKFITLLFVARTGDFGFREEQKKVYYIFVEAKDYLRAREVV